MTTDEIASRELKSLQDELIVLQKERAAVPAPALAPEATSSEPLETTENNELPDQLQEFAKEITGFFEEAEKSISSHPTQSVLGALLIGILIGRLLGRG